MGYALSGMRIEIANPSVEYVPGGELQQVSKGSGTPPGFSFRVPAGEIALTNGGLHCAAQLRKGGLRFGDDVKRVSDRAVQACFEPVDEFIGEIEEGMERYRNLVVDGVVTQPLTFSMWMAPRDEGRRVNLYDPWAQWEIDNSNYPSTISTEALLARGGRRSPVHILSDFFGALSDMPRDGLRPKFRDLENLSRACHYQEETHTLPRDTVFGGGVFYSHNSYLSGSSPGAVFNTLLEVLERRDEIDSVFGYTTKREAKKRELIERDREMQEFSRIRDKRVPEIMAERGVDENEAFNILIDERLAAGNAEKA
ncbi:MAG: hypothetical protein OXR66_03530 [Candidatus Woesearchaeota archaeon]|nr:hypothetical protein [Candidatus Woesearchaeota archaeon]